MGKLSLEKARAQKALEQSTTRRTFVRRLGISIGAVALIGVPTILIRNSLPERAPTYEEAFDNPELREQWLATIQSRPYQQLKLTTEEDKLRFRKTYGYDFPQGTFASTISLSDKPIGRGAKSITYVHQGSYGGSFDPVLRDHKKDLSIIIPNMLQNHEGIHSDHYNSGIPGFPEEMFMSNGSIDPVQFMAVSEVVAYQNEFNTLTNPNSSEFLHLYRQGLRKLARAEFMLITSKDLMNRVVEFPIIH